MHCHLVTVILCSGLALRTFEVLPCNINTSHNSTRQRNSVTTKISMDTGLYVMSEHGQKYKYHSSHRNARQLSVPPTEFLLTSLPVSFGLYSWRHLSVHPSSLNFFGITSATATSKVSSSFLLRDAATAPYDYALLWPRRWVSL